MGCTIAGGGAEAVDVNPGGTVGVARRGASLAASESFREGARRSFSRPGGWPRSTVGLNRSTVNGWNQQIVELDTQRELIRNRANSPRLNGGGYGTSRHRNGVRPWHP